MTLLRKCHIWTCASVKCCVFIRPPAGLSLYLVVFVFAALHSSPVCLQWCTCIFVLILSYDNFYLCKKWSFFISLIIFTVLCASLVILSVHLTVPLYLIKQNHPRWSVTHWPHHSNVLELVVFIFAALPSGSSCLTWPDLTWPWFLLLFAVRHYHAHTLVLTKLHYYCLLPHCNLWIL